MQTRGYHPSIHAMQSAQEERERREEAAAALRERKRENFERYGQTLQKLKSVDPSWERWFDDTLPDEWLWSEAEPVIALLEGRILQVSGTAYRWETPKVEYFCYTVTRPAKRGNKRVFVRFIDWVTKDEFARWWVNNKQAGWTVRAKSMNIRSIQ